jgi:hypothetical protein
MSNSSLSRDERISHYKARVVLDTLAEFGDPWPLYCPQNDDEFELGLIELVELRCRQLGWQGMQEIWNYFVLDLTVDFPHAAPSARPEATFCSEIQRISIAFDLGPDDVRNAIMAHLTNFKTEVGSY